MQARISIIAPGFRQSHLIRCSGLASRINRKSGLTREHGRLRCMNAGAPFAVLLCCSLLLVACDPTQPVADTAAGLSGAAIHAAVPSAEYRIDIVPGGRVQLIDGYFEAPVAPGAATRTRVSLGDQRAFGDLSADGREDAVVTLHADPGGSATLTYLAVLLQVGNEFHSPPALLLGDRIIVRSIAVSDGAISVALLERRPDEAMAVPPSIETSRSFRLRDGQLTADAGVP